MIFITIVIATVIISIVIMPFLMIIAFAAVTGLRVRGSDAQ